MSSRWGRDDARAFDDAWSRGVTPDDADIAELVRTAERICVSAAADMPPDFRAELRERLMREAVTVLVPASAHRDRQDALTRSTHPVRRRLVALVAALVAAVGSVGMVASSASAVPGDMLYPVKRGIESVELTLHRDDAARGGFRLSQASERLAEAAALAGHDSVRSHELVVETLDDFSEQAHTGSRALFDDFASRGDESSIALVHDFATAASARLSDLSTQIPASADAAFRAAAGTVDDLVGQASALCDDCAVADVSALAGAVDSLTQQPPAPAADSGDPTPRESDDDGGQSLTDAPTRGAATVAPPAPTEATSGPRPAPRPAPSPRPAPTPTEAPSLTDVTDPLLGPLLGDDDQVGLVPGLLDGLLGNRR